MDNAPNNYQQPGYAPNPYPQQNYAPNIQLRTNRGLGKMILLSLITFGIYGLVVWCHLSEEINTVASRYDGKKTMHFLIAMLLLSGITLGIVPLVWISKYCNRLGAEVARRGIDYKVGAGTFWGWGVLGSLIIVGPFIFCHKVLKASNLMNASYNTYG